MSVGFLRHQLTVCEHLSLMAVGGDGSVSGQSTGDQDSGVRGQDGDQGPVSRQRDH